jgi:hypothetical protein
MVSKRPPILYLVLILLFSAGILQAQESAAIQARATVIPAIVITDEHDLIFGTVLPNIDKTVDKTDIGFAGEWYIQGNNGAEVSLDFTLPDSLLHTDSSAFMRIDFSNIDASYDDGSGGGQTAPVADINPHGPSAMDLGATGELTVWIGGTVRPTLTQTGGDYTADIILTVQYTGN